MNSTEYIKSKLAQHYKKNTPTAPPDFAQREFGFGDVKKIDYRHFAFSTEEEFQKHFLEKLPMYASYSTAYYEFPSARPMEKKNYKGADLVFEFDAECKHDTLACEKCLQEMKENTIRLIEEFLVNDFGFNKQDISVSFSGNRGYHIHIRNKDIRQLSKNARKELVDYLQMTNVDFNELMKNATPESLGWKGKLAVSLYKFVENADENSLKETKFYPATREKILKQRQDILMGIKKGNFDLFKNSQKIWEKIAKQQIVKLSSDVDESVTMDTSRLIRIPSTIHSGTGFLANYVKDLDKFNPFKDAVVFMNYPEKVKVEKPIKEFVLKETTFGPFEKDQVISVPEYTAVFLVCKNAASPNP